jgi:hypothetical protein
LTYQKHHAIGWLIVDRATGSKGGYLKFWVLSSSQGTFGNSLLCFSKAVGLAFY